MAETAIAATDVVTVFGGSGFIGRHAVRALAKRGWRVKVAVRRPDLAFHLQPLGRVGQIYAVQANLRYPELIAAAVRGSSAVVNLVGVLSETGQQSFDALQATGAGQVAAAARAAGVKTFVQMSAIGADADSASDYARTKAEGEAAVREVYPDAAILRASIVFGPEDQFFNRFAALARMMPVLPLIGGQTKFQPVYVGDVAEAIARTASGGGTPGSAYELGGPEVRTMRELLTYVCKVIGRRRPLLPIPFGLAHYVPALATEMANFLLLGAFPKMLLTTRDQVELLRHDNVVSPQAAQGGRTLQGLGIEPTAIDLVVPDYLWRFRRTGQFERRQAI